MNVKKNLFLLWILCILGSLALLPYTYHIGIVPVSASFHKIFLISFFQSVFLFGFICLLSYMILQKVEINPFIYSNFLKRIIFPGIVFGVLLALVLFILQKTLFQFGLNPVMHWSFFLACIYGAINEEVLLRLFFLTLIYYFFTKIFKDHVNHKKGLLLSAILISSFIFALLHLPSLYKLDPSFSNYNAFGVVVLNILPGIVYGWLYCYRGFWAGALAHFTTNVLMQFLI